MSRDQLNIHITLSNGLIVRGYVDPEAVIAVDEGDDELMVERFGIGSVSGHDIYNYSDGILNIKKSKIVTWFLL